MQREGQGAICPKASAWKGTKMSLKNVKACLFRENGNTLKDMFVNIINDGRKYLFGERSPEKNY